MCGEVRELEDKGFITLYERRKNAEGGHVVIVDDDLRELDRLEWVFRQFNIELIFHNMKETFIHCIHALDSNEAETHIKELLSKYGHSEKPFVLFLDCYLGRDKDIFPALKTLPLEHPELIMMAFTAKEDLPDELLKYCKEKNILHRAKPENGKDEDFFRQMRDMLIQSTPKMEARKRIDDAWPFRDTNDELVHLINSWIKNLLSKTCLKNRVQVKKILNRKERVDQAPDRSGPEGAVRGGIH